MLLTCVGVELRQLISKDRLHILCRFSCSCLWPQQMWSSSSVAVSLEVKVELQDASVKASFEAVSLWHLPLFVHNRKGDVLVRNSSTETNRQRVSRSIWLQKELRCSCLVSQVWEEDVEFVALDDLRGWIFRVVMRLVVLVPLITLFDWVEEARLAHHKQLLLWLH